MALSNPDLQQRCYELIDRLLARYNWELLDREEFLRRTIAAYNDHPSADLSYLAFGVYNQALYTACSGAEGPFRWEQGYKEMFEMLCARAQRAYPNVWEDVVQSALELTCTRLERCRVPQAFFQFAWGQLQNAVRSQHRHVRREDNRVELPLERSLGEGAVSLIETIPDPGPALIEIIMREAA